MFVTSASLSDVLAQAFAPGTLRHRENIPARSADSIPWPDWVHPAICQAFISRGVSEPWSHQVEAAESIHAGRNTVIATGTASGKSLGMWLTPLTEAVTHPEGVTLYLSPTKALAGDQQVTIDALALPELRTSLYDGDTASDDRLWARKHANTVFTNPDMLHYTVLPHHQRHRRWLRSLRYIIVDEAHHYRGVFGSHVALILRRLLRLANLYGAVPVVIGASATLADPASSFTRLIGCDSTAITRDASPRGSGQFLFWDPLSSATGAQPETGVAETLSQPQQLATQSHKSGISSTTHLLKAITDSGYRSLAFISSRHGSEVVAERVRQSLIEENSSAYAAGATANDTHINGAIASVAAYRGGYLPEERRELERRLRSGELRTVIATNALELGINISGLDVVVIMGWPGTLASLWQQAGRAGRAGQEWAVVFIARDDPLDTYIVHHPQSVFDTQVAAAVISPDNPFVLKAHLCSAAAEAPLTVGDSTWFGDTFHTVVDDLVHQGSLRDRPSGWFWTHRESPSSLVDMRGSGANFRIIDIGTGELIGTTDEAGAHRALHPGAIYMHQGATYHVVELDLEAEAALVESCDPAYATRAHTETDIHILQDTAHHILQRGGRLCTGDVEVRSRVTAFHRLCPRTGKVLSRHSLDLPERVLTTQAVWWCLPEKLFADANITTRRIPGALHAGEHAAIGLLPLFAGCDRWDIGGVSTPWHPDTDSATVFVYDGHTGGAGFSKRGYEQFTDWQQATYETISSCPCTSGCPSCIQSPKCGNGNEPLDKTGALAILRALL